MEWVTPEHERAEINAAARVLLKNGSLADEEQQWASDIVNNWRYAHNYPLNTFKVTLREYAKKAFGAGNRRQTGRRRIFGCSTDPRPERERSRL